MPERGTFGHPLIQPDPILPAASVDFTQSARDFKRASFAAQTDHMGCHPGCSASIEGLPLTNREVACYPIVPSDHCPADFALMVKSVCAKGEDAAPKSGIRGAT